jgi:hypothetical protein
LIGALIGTTSAGNTGGLVRIMLNGNRVVGEERLLSGRVRDLVQAADGAEYGLVQSSN